MIVMMFMSTTMMFDLSEVVDRRRDSNLAAEHGHSDVVKLLLEDLEAGSDKDNLAAGNGDSEVVKLLSEACATF